MIGRYHGNFPGADLLDGNCLFKALPIAIFGESFHHATIRKLLCDYFSYGSNHYIRVSNSGDLLFILSETYLP